MTKARPSAPLEGDTSNVARCPEQKGGQISTIISLHYHSLSAQMFISDDDDTDNDHIQWVFLQHNKCCNLATRDIITFHHLYHKYPHHIYIYHIYPSEMCWWQNNRTCTCICINFIFVCFWLRWRYPWTQIFVYFWLRWGYPWIHKYKYKYLFISGCAEQWGEDPRYLQPLQLPQETNWFL